MSGRGERCCRCGHALAAHEHLRRGTDCALCSTGSCPQYRPTGSLARRLMARVLGIRLRRLSWAAPH